MKKMYIKTFIALFAVTLIASTTLFYACKKEEVAKDIVTKEWQEKIEYMEIPCIDFARIKKDGGSKGTSMLRFESWDHYATVIDAMLDFSYNYIETRVQQVRNENPDIDDDDLSLILHNEGVYQFMPLYSFCQQLQFDNSAFHVLRSEEIKWMNNSASDINNPFDEMSMGYIQSALHNSYGEVMIGNEIFNPSIGLDAKGCRHNERLDNSSTGKEGIWPTYNYNNKKREFRAFIHSQQSYTYAKTSMYYFNKQNKRIVWLCNLSIATSGVRYGDCYGQGGSIISFGENGRIFASVQEKYSWYSTYPNYLWGGMYKHSVNTGHHAPGKSYYLAL